MSGRDSAPNSSTSGRMCDEKAACCAGLLTGSKLKAGERKSRRVRRPVQLSARATAEARRASERRHGRAEWKTPNCGVEDEEV